MQQSIFDKVKSYEDACKIKGIKPLTLEQFSFLPKDDQLAMFSLHKITTVIEALNEGVVFDWNDYDQNKYYPWFDMQTYDEPASVSGFSFYVYDFVLTLTFVGARLCLDTREKAEYVGKLLLEEYRNWMKK